MFRNGRSMKMERTVLVLNLLPFSLSRRVVKQERLLAEVELLETDGVQ